MHCYRCDVGDEHRLIAVLDEEGYDLTGTTGSPREFGELARIAADREMAVGEHVTEIVPDAQPVGLDGSEPSGDVSVPVLAEEVWAAGVTYQISEQAREAESGMPEIYLDVYDADRPELFFKATGRRVVGPNDRVGIRADSEWDVPEPELAIVIHDGEIVGYTIGNDMSSRSIEGENPLYLPQAKVYERSCSIGPCVVPASSRTDWDDLEMQMQIERDGSIEYDDSTSTSQIVRSHEELVSYLYRHNDMPETSVLLTGTSLVPEEDFTLAEDDQISITIEGIGRLENSVTTV